MTQAQPAEHLEGYVVDVACIRDYPREELASRAREHTRACGLEGHCTESGYGLVDDSGRVVVLDAAATPMVHDALRRSDQQAGIKVHVRRERRGERMHTTGVEEEISG